MLNDLGVGNQGITREKFMPLSRSWNCCMTFFAAESWPSVHPNRRTVKSSKVGLATLVKGG